MKIIIPMTGYGSRFVSAGYDKLKPFIEVDGMPMIEWIVTKMYKGESDFIFICRQEHLDTHPYIRETLNRIAPNGQIVAIKNWIKKGPAYDVLMASEIISNEEPCIINYCDFYMTWNWKKFKNDVLSGDYDGCIPCYTGFHPNLIPPYNVYASCLTDENDCLIEIKEKHSFSNKKEESKHSPGVYFFKSGEILKKYCKKLISSNETINGEYYVSLIYNFLIADDLNVWVPCNVEKFCQWGTPEDLEEYIYWTTIVKEMR